MTRYPTCFFCKKNTSEPSKEDVLAKWIAREFPDGKFSRFETEGGFVNAGPDRRFKSRGHFGIVTTRPCKRCNNEWMSDLEKKVQQIFPGMFRGIPRLLDANDRTYIAQWLTKTAMMFELHIDDRTTPRYFKPVDRTAMCKQQTIPPGTFIFLAQYVGKHVGVLSHAGAADIIVYPDTPNAVRSYGYTATFVIGQLALQIFSVRRPKNLTEPLLMKMPGQWHQATIEIWPRRILGNMNWPPPEAFDDEVIDAFMNRWTTVRP